MDCCCKDGFKNSKVINEDVNFKVTNWSLLLGNSGLVTSKHFFSLSSLVLSVHFLSISGSVLWGRRG